MFFFLSKKQAKFSEACFKAGKAKVEVDTVDSLMRRPAMPIKKLKCKSRTVAELFSETERRAIRSQETLRESLARLKGRQAKKRATARDRPAAPKLRNEGKVPKQPKGNVVVSNEQLPKDTLLEVDSASNSDEVDTCDQAHARAGERTDTEVRVLSVDEGKALSSVANAGINCSMSSFYSPFLDEDAPTKTERDDVRSCLHTPGVDLAGGEKAVTFHEIEIRSYKRCLGDNPACSTGPAVSLGWDYQPCPRAYSVDEYEARRGTRRVLDELQMPEEWRIELLVEEGYTFQELLEADIQKTMDQLLRENTLGNLSSDRWKDMFETIRSKYMALHRGDNR